MNWHQDQLNMLLSEANQQQLPQQNHHYQASLGRETSTEVSTTHYRQQHQRLHMTQSVKKKSSTLVKEEDEAERCQEVTMLGAYDNVKAK